MDREPQLFRASAESVAEEVNKGIKPRSSKKRRFFDDSCFVDINLKTHARFLGFHFDILQSLYTAEAIGGEAVLDATVWTMIKSFLQQREQLLQAKQEAFFMQGIHSEAVRYVESGAAKKMMANYQSPDKSHAHSIPRLSQKSSPVNSQNKKYSSQTSASSPPIKEALYASSLDHFHIVTHLLGRRSNIVKTSFKQQADPFQVILKLSETHILSLRQDLHELQQALRIHDQKRIQDLVAANVYKSKAVGPAKDDLSEKERSAELSRMVEMECKIRLWSLLSQDLREGISCDRVTSLLMR